ncbi:MAG: phosphomevalonate kinase [Candidatus Aenigmatarchaeota archaeon]
MKRLKISAPGKLMLAGEWAILEMGNPGLIAAVNKRVWVEIEPTNKIIINIKDFDIENLGAIFDGKELKWERGLTEKEKIDTQFIKGAIETTLKYLGRWHNFKIISWGEQNQIEIDGKSKKIGFGSSAASVVATVAALLKMHGQDIASMQAKERIYKLATIAHYFVQGKLGSGFDVAAATFGGVFVYKRFDSAWLVQQIESGKSIKEIVEKKWPGLYIEQLDIPKRLKLIVGWTRSSASTTAMIRQMEGFKMSQFAEYKRIFSNIAKTVEILIENWKKGNREGILTCIKKNRALLQELTKKSDISIETEELKRLADLAEQVGAAGKLSGAGGGDCGIAICFDAKTEKEIKKRWTEAGLWPLDVKIDKNGVK